MSAAAATGSRTVAATIAGRGGGTARTIFNDNTPLPTKTRRPPTRGTRLQTLDVVFTGTGYITGVTTVDFGVDFTVNSATANSAGTQLTANITIAVTAATGSRTVTVTNPGPGGGSATATFTVNNPAPTLSSIAPTSGTRLQTLDVVFTGSDYISGVTTVDFGSNITVNSTTVTSTTSLTANITITATAPTGARTVTVTNPNPGGGSATASVTVDNPAPTLTSIAPTSGTRLQTLDVVF